jgi:hypothetical protein
MNERKNMNQKEKNAKLAKVKIALAEKCERLEKSVKSLPRKRSMKYHASRFRRQAADLTR